MPIGPDVVDRLLGVPPDQPEWWAADMANRAGILATWLSARADLPAGPAAYLERMRRRVAGLHAAGEELAAAHGVRVIKGERIARHYPAPLHRQSGDVDLIAPGQASLWECVLDLRDRYGARPQGVTVLDAPEGVHVGVWMKWPAEEPWLDKPMGADITTCAFAGDLKGVPVREAGPDDDDLCGLIAVAEERFQRKYRVKDRLDLLVLADVLQERFGDELIGRVCAAADAQCLAPELRSLIRSTDDWVPVSPLWHAVADALGPLVREEKARRRPERAGLYRVRYGFPLDERGSADLAVRLVERPGGAVATTPLGTVLLDPTRVLDEETIADALEFARTLGEEVGHASLHRR
jgi:hypothetical protein